MSSNVFSVSALEQASFQLFAESVKTHSSSTQFCRQGAPRCRAAHSECATTMSPSYTTQWVEFYIPFNT